MRPRRSTAAPLLTLLLTSAIGCGDDPVDLIVDLKTDLVPGLQFVSIRTEIGPPGLGDGAEATEMDQSLASTGDDYLRGRRIAEFGGLETGDVAVRVTLFDAGGAQVASRMTLVRLEEDYALTVIITGSCQGVSCPGPGDSAAQSACVGGRCVDPRCSVAAPEYCGDPGCGGDADCAAAVECAQGRCVDSECFVRVDDAACEDGRVCHPSMGCVGLPEADAGPACRPSETICMDGLDDDCDGQTDCADADCATACAECGVDADCGVVSYGDWDSCQGFAEPCGETGTHARTVQTPRCTGGACTVETGSESEACSRDTDSITCGAPTIGGWGACGGFASPCATAGTQSRTITAHTCVAGSCQDQPSTEMGSCTRTVTNGTSCGGSGWEVCCGGGCIDTRNNAAHCGSCGVNCGAVGLSCTATGSGGYSCRACSSNAQCITVLNSAATCWDLAAPPSFCQCQCAANGVCANGGCGTNMFCHDCTGHNFCSPVGGGC